jgi:hypothetical protein
MKCEGSCEQHHGEVVSVRVIDKDTGQDWGLFNYCEEAIQEDLRRGFEVKRIKKKRGL